MKRLVIIGALLFVIVLDGCERQEFMDPQPKQVQDFLNSKEFKKNECTVVKYGRIGIGKVEVLIKLNKSVEQLMIPIIDKDNIVAYIQVMKLPENNLPDKEVYFMNLIDLNKFDNNTLTGTVKMFGLNYGGFQHLELTVIGNKISFLKSFPAPKEFGSSFSKGFLKDFLACYRQMRDWQDSIDLLKFVCDWAMQSCATAATVWCIWELATS